MHMKKTVAVTESQPNHDVLTITGSKFDTDQLWLGNYLPVSNQSFADENFPAEIIKDTGDYVLIEDYSGPMPIERSRDDELDYISADTELDALDRWHDKEPELHTHALNGWYIGPKSNGERRDWTYASDAPQRQEVNLTDRISEQERNVYVEANDGFIARQVLDDELTRKYQARLLNVFRDKRTGDIRIGSVRIVHGTDTITAECVNYRCEASTHTISTLDLTRDSMVEFVYAVIRHGNNHAAQWFTSRPEFYELQPLSPVSDPVTNPVIALFNHQDNCTDPQCGCVDFLSSLVPLFKEAV